MVDERGVDAALRLRTLARVVHQERVDQGEIAEGGVRAAGGGEARVLAGQPLQVAVLAQVDHRVRAETVVLGGSGDPAVRGQVVVGRREIGVVVDRDRVLAEAARRLDEDEQVPAPQGREDDVALRVGGAVDEHLAGGRAPVLLHRLPQLLREFGEPAAVVGGRDPDRVLRQLLLGQPLLVVAARLDEGIDQLVAVAGDQARDLLLGAEVVPLGAQAAQQGHGAWRGCRGRPRCRCGSASSGRPTAPARSSSPRWGSSAAWRGVRRCRRPGPRARRRGRTPGARPRRSP
ncbi:hypothetical protein GA0115255_128022 [Streptomyces sp. Ncost-T6T-2b]|nr:hypothetical protein GA0115255_128022 [Streptomyces sp. Ncost-T6T-2b]